MFPGIAVARELQQLDPGADILFVGSDKELEQSILARLNLRHRSLPVESLRLLSRHPFRFVLRNWQAWRIARQWIREVRPAVVVGLGGYASAPIVWAAARARIPAILLEQNVIPGRTTRWLARSARLVCTSFSEASRNFPRGTTIEVTGNPIRREISSLFGSHFENDPKELLVLGGSQGADRLNDAVLGAVTRLRNEFSGWRIVHQSGPRQVESLRAAYRALNLNCRVEPFFDDMAARYQSASLVISRAGATTLAELMACGLPMILLPYPQAADDHQRANAIALRDQGAAVIVEHQSNPEETTNDLATQLHRFLADSKLRQQLGNAAHRMATPNAALIVARQISSIANG